MNPTTRLLTFIACCLILAVPSSVAQETACEASDHYGACIISAGHTDGVALDRPFAMHSVMKFPQALYVADWMRQNDISLSDSVLVRRSELMPDTWSPMLTMFGDQQHFTYAQLLELSLAQSDNNACDLLFRHAGSPACVSRYMKALGFGDIHVRLTEREMGAAPARASENSSTPRAMALLFEWFYDHRDSNRYLNFVWQTMAECHTGPERLPATLPDGANIVHKTGTGFTYPDQTRDRNDAGIILLPDGTHYTLAVFAPRSGAECDVARIAENLSNTISPQ